MASMATLLQEAMRRAVRDEIAVVRRDLRDMHGRLRVLEQRERQRTAREAADGGRTGPKLTPDRQSLRQSTALAEMSRCVWRPVRRGSSAPGFRREG